MNRKSYNTEDLRSYLLGLASATDTEQMDELSVTDNEFADVLEAAEKDLVDTYVQGELDADVLRRFDEYYRASPLRREKVRFARAFKEYSDERLTEGRSGKKTGSATDEKHTSFLTRITGFGRLWPVPTFAAAAAVLAVLVLLGWLAVRDRNEKDIELAANVNSNGGVLPSFPSPIPQSSPIPSGNILPTDPKESPTREIPSPTAKPKAPTQTVIASFVLRPPLRGTSVPTVQVLSTATRANVRLELESDDFASYSVELRNAEGGVIWSKSRVKPSKSNGTPSLTLNFPTKTLTPSVYTIRVSGRSDDGTAEIVGDYPFRIVR